MSPFLKYKHLHFNELKERFHVKQAERIAAEKRYKEYNERLNNLLEIVINQVRTCKIPASRNINSNVFINTRAKKRFGACRLSKTKGHRFFTIEISSDLYNSTDEIIMGVMAHEVLHTCNGAMNHGERWKRYASIMNKTYGYNIKRVSTTEEMDLPNDKNIKAANAKYMIKCEKCGSEIYRMRKSNVVNNPEKYRCKCGGKLQVYVIKHK